MDPELEKLIMETDTDSSDGSLSDEMEDSVVDEMPSIPDELIVGVIGNVDSGKSTTVGVLVTGDLDDGRGSARAKVQYFSHERVTGRTSSVSSNFIRTDRKTIEFIDLPGHRKYLRTTMHGLSGRSPDYALIMVGANMGISRQTKEHLEIALSLGIPFMVIVTKIDIAPKNVLKDNLKIVAKWVKKSGSSQTIISNYKKPMSDDDVKRVIEMMSLSNRRICPIILISNKKGYNVDRLREIVMGLEPRFKALPDSPSNGGNADQLFNVIARYRVVGVGTVVSGRVLKGRFKAGDRLFVGPLQGQWVPVVVKSLHNNFREFVDELGPGQSGCLAIKSTKKKVKLADVRFRKGVIIANYQKMTTQFIASVAVRRTGNDTTMQVGYQPVINCGPIAQAAAIKEIIEAPTENVIRGGDRAVLRFEFTFRPEHINVGDRFIFREGSTKGVGIIQELLQ